MKDALKHAGRAAAGMLPVALLARLSVPALAALVFLAILVLGVTCWIISDPARSDRVTRMMLARQGDARCLEPGTSTRHLPLPGPCPVGDSTPPWRAHARSPMRWLKGVRLLHIGQTSASTAATECCGWAWNSYSYGEPQSGCRSPKSPARVTEVVCTDDIPGVSAGPARVRKGIARRTRRSPVLADTRSAETQSRKTSPLSSPVTGG